MAFIQSPKNVAIVPIYKAENINLLQDGEHRLTLIPRSYFVPGWIKAYAVLLTGSVEGSPNYDGVVKCTFGIEDESSSVDIFSDTTLTGFGGETGIARFWNFLPGSGTIDFGVGAFPCFKAWCSLDVVSPDTGASVFTASCFEIYGVRARIDEPEE